MKEEYQYIIDSYINGQLRQAKELFFDLGNIERDEFIIELKNYNLGGNGFKLSMLSFLARSMSDKI